MYVISLHNWINAILPLCLSLSLTHSFGYGNLSPTLSEYYTNGLVFQIRFVFTFGSFKRHTQHLINLCVSCKITDIPLSIVPHQLHKFTHMKLTSETIRAVSYQFNWFGVCLIHVVKTWYEWMLLTGKKSISQWEFILSFQVRLKINCPLFDISTVSSIHLMSARKRSHRTQLIMNHGKQNETELNKNYAPLFFGERTRKLRKIYSIYDFKWVCLLNKCWLI